MTRRVLHALDARASAKIAAEVWVFHVPTICGQSLDDKRRVQWVQGRVGTPALSEFAGRHDQQIGQIFCNVIEAWGEDLVKRNAPEPQAIMTDSDLTSWRVAMLKYPWELQV